MNDEVSKYAKDAKDGAVILNAVQAKVMAKIKANIAQRKANIGLSNSLKEQVQQVEDATLGIEGAIDQLTFLLYELRDEIQDPPPAIQADPPGEPLPH